MANHPLARRVQLPGGKGRAKLMKVNFNGNYEQVKWILNTPAQPVKRGPEDFAKLLASVSPSAQGAEKTKVKADESKAEPEKTLQGGPLARFKPPEPELKPPEFFGRIDSNSAESAVNDLPHDVKPSLQPPRILKAQRVSETEATKLGKLSLEQRIQEVKSLVEAAGKKHAIDPALGLAVVANESSFDPNAVSSDGFNTKGLFQLLDSTGKDMVERLDVKARYNPFNPPLNVELGVGYLRYLHDIFSNETELPNKMKTAPAANSASLEKLAVAAFNAGEGRVASAQSRALAAGRDPGKYDDIQSYLPESTQKYVDRVMLARGRFEARFID